MASQLREVLDHFNHQTGPISIKQMAAEMNVTPGMLDGMINYWVRKGRLREVNSSGEACTTCGVKGACPFVVALPRYYEVVSDDTPETPPCGCGDGACGV